MLSSRAKVSAHSTVGLEVHPEFFQAQKTSKAFLLGKERDLTFYKKQSTYNDRMLNPEANNMKWTLEKNIAFLAGGIKAGREFLLVSDVRKVIETANYFYKKGGVSYTAVELLWLRDHGYTFKRNPDYPLQLCAIPPKEPVEFKFEAYDKNLTVKDLRWLSSLNTLPYPQLSEKTTVISESVDYPRTQKYRGPSASLKLSASAPKSTSASSSGYLEKSSIAGDMPVHLGGETTKFVPSRSYIEMLKGLKVTANSPATNVEDSLKASTESSVSAAVSEFKSDLKSVEDVVLQPQWLSANNIAFSR